MSYCPEGRHHVLDYEITSIIVPQPKGRPTIKRLMCMHCKERILARRREIRRNKSLA